MGGLGERQGAQDGHTMQSIKRPKASRWEGEGEPHQNSGGFHYKEAKTKDPGYNNLNIILQTTACLPESALGSRAASALQIFVAAFSNSLLFMTKVVQ